jgi:hypothetical protein
MPITPRRDKYPLLFGEYSLCRVDNTAWSVDEMGETSFFNNNVLNYARFPEFETSDNYKIKLQLARTLEWSPDCQETVPVMTGKKEELNETYKQFKIMVTVYSVAFGFTIIVICGNFFIFLMSWKQVYKLTFVFRVLMFSMALPPIVIVYTRTRNFYKFFDRIQELGCSNNDTNRNFAEFTDSVKKDLGFKTEVALGLLIAGFGLECLICVFAFCIFPKDHYEETSAPSELKYKPEIPPTPVVGLQPGKNTGEAQPLQNPTSSPELQNPLPPGFLESQRKQAQLPPGFAKS